MKTLYVSDLDGTLLQENAILSEYSKKEILRLSAEGINFTIATARSITTVNTILDGLHFDAPVILLNGAAIYDFTKKEYINIEKLSKNALSKVVELVEKYKISGFFFEIANGVHITHYDRQDTDYVKNYIIERRRLYGEESIAYTPIDKIEEKNIVYFSSCGKQESLEKFFEEVKKFSGIHIEFYRDVYLKDHYFIEIASEKSSKRNAILLMKEKYGYDRVISFGDNLNDIAMFSVSDESYAVANAREEVIEKATGVIGANTADSVVRWLSENAKKN